MITELTNKHDFLDRETASKIIKFTPATLAVWDCLGLYDLQPEKIGRKIRYRKAHFVKRFNHCPNDPTDELFDRKTAAKYIDTSDGTMAVWDCTKRYNLKPLIIGRSVRYSRTNLDRFLISRLYR